MNPTIEFKVTDKTGRELTQKAPERCYNCGYFYHTESDDSPYFSCHYPEDEPAAWAPCEYD